MGAYRSEFRRSIESRDEFWLDAARAIDWSTMPTRALDDSNPPLYRWFPDGELNTAFNALDRHADGGRGDQPALIWDSAVTDAKRTYSYRELRDEVARFAGGLASLGVEKGDRVIIYMPMVPEAVIAMLACARLGAVHSVVFGGFAPRELAARIDDARPTLIIAASCGIEPTRIVEYQPIVDQALSMTAHQPGRIVMLQRDANPAPLGPRYLEWAELMADAKPVDPVPVKATDPLYILYTSGTTGRPKGVVRDAGGHAVALTYSMNAVYDIHPGDVWWTASDVGWVVGHSYICYAPLLIGATSVMYEGKPVGTPDAGAFWRVIAETGAKALFTAPTALRAIKRVDPDGKEIAKYDLSAFRTLFMAGERLDPDTLGWARDKLGVPVIDHWWQTETGWPIAANLRGLEPMTIKPGSATVAVPGWDVRILDPEGAELTAWASRARSPSRCRYLLGRSRRSGTTISATWRNTCPATTGTTSPATVAIATRTAIYTSWAAPTMSSTSLATDCRLVRWRRSWPRIRPSRNAQSSASRTSSKVSSRAVSSFSKPGSISTRTRFARSLSMRSAAISARWRLSATSTSSPACPRRALARYCARPCVASPKGETSRCRRRSKIRACSTSFGRSCRRTDPTDRPLGQRRPQAGDSVLSPAHWVWNTPSRSTRR